CDGRRAELPTQDLLHRWTGSWTGGGVPRTNTEQGECPWAQRRSASDSERLAL
ncbi:hypothetical protein BGZ97_004916, partial [Linnemannia gamsii]